MTGTFAEPMSRKVGGYEYRFPVVKADTVYLWPKRPERIVYYNRWLDWPWGPRVGMGRHGLGRGSGSRAGPAGTAPTPVRATPTKR